MTYKLQTVMTIKVFCSHQLKVKFRSIYKQYRENQDNSYGGRGALLYIFKNVSMNCFLINEFLIYKECFE